MRTVSPASWGAWYAEDRLLFHARRAGIADPALDRVVERLASGDFDDDAAPARIHGDLWSGNVLWSPDGVVLIDPAAHGGHRLTDLAMLALFGTPQLARIHAAYAEASDRLPDGWGELIGLHNCIRYWCMRSCSAAGTAPRPWTSLATIPNCTKYRYGAAPRQPFEMVRRNSGDTD